jgi:hypothetical protein
MMSEDIPQRSVLLRGALATCCSLWAPIARSEPDAKDGAASSCAVRSDSQASSADATPPALIRPGTEHA